MHIHLHIFPILIALALTQPTPLAEPISRFYRFKRGVTDQELSNLQSHITSLARVVTSVSLLNGLIDGSIPTDKVIAELMNVEKLDDLNKLDKKTMDDFIGKLKETSGKLSTKTESLERHVVNFNRMKEMWSEVGDLKNLPDQKFFDNIKSLEALDLSAFDKFDPKNLDSIGKACKSALDILEGKGVLKGLESLDSFHRYAAIMNLYDNSNPVGIQRIGDPIVKELETEINELEGLTRGEFIGIMASTFKASFNRQFTSGLLNGLHDLKMLQDDMKNEWVLKITKEPISNISILLGLSSSLDSLDQKWKSVATPSNKRTLLTASSIQTHFGAIKGASSSLKSVISSFSSLIFLVKDDAFSNEVQKLTGNLRQLEKQAKTIKEVSSLIPNSQDQGTSKKLEQLIQFLASIPKMKDVTTEISAQAPDAITNFHSDATIKQYLAFFGQLSKVSKDPKQVAAAAELALKIRDVKSDPNFFKDLEAVAALISDSPPLITAIQEKMMAIKATPKDSITSLLNLKDLQKYSKPLGDAVNILFIAVSSLNKRSDFDGFLKNGPVIDMIVENIKDPKLEIQIRQNWKDMMELERNVPKLLEKLEKWKNTIRAPEVLTDYEKVFKGLEGLEDVKLETMLKLDSIEGFAGKVTNSKEKSQLDSLKTSLVELSSLDLTFSRYSSALGNISETLNGIIELFANFEATTTAGEDGGMSWKMILGICLGVAAVLGIVIVIFGWLKLGWFKKKKNTAQTSSSSSTIIPNQKSKTDSSAVAATPVQQPAVPNAAPSPNPQNQNVNVVNEHPQNNLNAAPPVVVANPGGVQAQASASAQAGGPAGGPAGGQAGDLGDVQGGGANRGRERLRAPRDARGDGPAPGVVIPRIVPQEAARGKRTTSAPPGTKLDRRTSAVDFQNLMAAIREGNERAKHDRNALNLETLDDDSTQSKNSYFKDQDDDDTLWCVKSIEASKKALAAKARRNFPGPGQPRAPAPPLPRPQGGKDNGPIDDFLI